MSIGPREDSSELGNDGSPMLDLQTSTSGIQISVQKSCSRVNFPLYFISFIDFCREVFRVIESVVRVIIYSFYTYSIDRKIISSVTIIFCS